MPDHISAMIHHIDNVPLTTPCKYICHPLQFHHCNGSGWMIMIYASTADRSCIYIKDKMLFNTNASPNKSGRVHMTMTARLMIDVLRAPAMCYEFDWVFIWLGCLSWGTKGRRTSVPPGTLILCHPKPLTFTLVMILHWALPMHAYCGIHVVDTLALPSVTDTIRERGAFLVL